MPNKVTKFVNDVKLEMGKVSWPTRDELVSSTIVVLVSTALLAVFIGICDVIFSSIINIVMRFL